MGCKAAPDIKGIKCRQLSLQIPDALYIALHDEAKLSGYESISMLVRALLSRSLEVKNGR